MGFVSIPPDYGAIEFVRAGRRARRARLIRRANFSKATQRSARSACRMPSTLALCAVVEPGWGEATDPSSVAVLRGYIGPQALLRRVDEPAREDARPTEMPNCTAPRWLRLLFG